KQNNSELQLKAWYQEASKAEWTVFFYSLFIVFLNHEKKIRSTGIFPQAALTPASSIIKKISLFVRDNNPALFFSRCTIAIRQNKTIYTCRYFERKF
ncbi:hypothetical protein ABTL58_19155, partial [Acinetobacter baumannii]